MGASYMVQAESKEFVTFTEARDMILDRKNVDKGIELMIGLSLEAQSRTLRLWAKTFMRKEMRVAIQENDDETQSEAGIVQG